MIDSSLWPFRCLKNIPSPTDQRIFDAYPEREEARSLHCNTNPVSPELFSLLPPPPRRRSAALVCCGRGVPGVAVDDAVAVLVAVVFVVGDDGDCDAAAGYSGVSFVVLVVFFGGFVGSAAVASVAAVAHAVVP